MLQAKIKAAYYSAGVEVLPWPTVNCKVESLTWISQVSDAGDEYQKNLFGTLPSRHETSITNDCMITMIVGSFPANEYRNIRFILGMLVLIE